MRGSVTAPGTRAASLAWVMSTDKEVKEPEAALAVMFGMRSACKKDTYVGTAPHLKGATLGGASPDGRPRRVRT